MHVQAGSKVQFKAGREGTFDPTTKLDVKDVVGQFAIVDVGRSEWSILVERLEPVDG